MIRFVVPGEPLPAERPRTVLRRGKGGRMVPVTITPDRTLAAETRVAAAFRAAYPTYPTDATHLWTVDAVFWRETQRSADLDNLLKVVLDGLNGVLWADDRQVSHLSASRVLGVGKAMARTIVEARPLPGQSATLEVPAPATNGDPTP